MKKRHGLSRAKNKKIFRRGAQNVHPNNGIRKITRGGIRL